MVKGWSTSGQSLAVYAVGFCRSRRTNKNPPAGVNGKRGASTKRSPEPMRKALDAHRHASRVRLH